jgi:hypothetical protein
VKEGGLDWGKEPWASAPPPPVPPRESRGARAFGQSGRVSTLTAIRQLVLADAKTVRQASPGPLPERNDMVITPIADPSLSAHMPPPRPAHLRTLLTPPSLAPYVGTHSSSSLRPPRSSSSSSLESAASL